MGLLTPVGYYMDDLEISVTSCAEFLPEPETLVNDIIESFNEYRVVLDSTQRLLPTYSCANQQPAVDIFNTINDLTKLLDKLFVRHPFFF